MAHDPHHLPDGLAVPVDDGACDHLVGLPLPSVPLPSTSGPPASPAELASEWAVFYVYPRTGVPGVEMPAGWDSIPGARGCTPQSCSYRDDYEQFRSLGVGVYGLSTQMTEAQQEFAGREHIPFPLLSDSHREFGETLGLPTFGIEDDVLYRRLTLVAHRGKIVHVRYPVFPPNEDAPRTLEWLHSHIA